MKASMRIARTCEGLGAIGHVRARHLRTGDVGHLAHLDGSATARSMLGPMAPNRPQKIAAGTEELAPSAETVAQRAKASAAFAKADPASDRYTISFVRPRSSRQAIEKNITTRSDLACVVIFASWRCKNCICTKSGKGSRFSCRFF